MTWMKVDDGLYDHPKMFDAPDCAIALWTRAGSWVARSLTDGFVPAGMARRLCDDPDRAVKELVTRGLWDEVDGGFVFHDWLDYNRSKEQVLAERARDRDQKARARAELAEKRRKRRSTRPPGTPAGTPPGTPTGSPRLPDPGSLPSSGNPAAAPVAPAAPSAVPAVHVPTSSPEVRAEALRAVPASLRKSKRAPSGARPLVASVRAEVASGASGGSSRPSSTGSPSRPDPRAEQDRLAELDAVQADPAAPDERVPPSSDVHVPAADLRGQESA